MNRLRLLLTMPWVASAPYSRWIVAGAFCLLLLLGLVFGAEVVAGKAAPRSVIWIAGFAIWLLWSGYVSANFQLARDARLLRLPGIARDADLSMLLFAVLGVVVPVLACWVLRAPEPFAAAMFVTAAVGGLAYMLLPLYLGVPLTVGLFILLMLRGTLMPVTAWAALVVPLIVVVVWRWRALRAPKSYAAGWNMPAVFYCYRLYNAQRGGLLPVFPSSLLQRQLARPVRVDLHRVGPDRPVASLRVALGGFGMPKPLAARLRDMGSMAGCVLVFLLILVLPQTLSANQYLSTAAGIRLGLMAPMLAFFGVCMCLLGVTAFAGRTLATWRKPDAELALLALLPGLGSPSQSKRNTLRALLLPPAVFLCVTLAVFCMGAFGIHAKWWAYLSITLSCLGAFGLVAAYTLEMLGGRGVHMAAYILVNIALFGLTVLVMTASLPTDQYHGPHPERIGFIPIWLLLLWAVFLVSSSVFAGEGWHALRKRAHSFLANPR